VTTATMPTTPTRQRRPVVLLRPVPGTSPVHELWAGTKMVAVGLIAVPMALAPGWVSMGLVTAFLLLVARRAGVSWTALPSMPRWLWILLAVGTVVAAFAGGAPDVVLGPVTFGLGGLLSYLQLLMVALVMMGACALVSWTTNVADIAPAVAKLCRPLEALRVPVDDWAVTLALSLRAFPMLVQEFRVLFAARRLRPRAADATTWRENYRRRTTDLVDVMAATMTVSLRRADEMGDAITARGGSGQISASPSRPKRADFVALAVVFALSVLAFYVENFTALSTAT
jgi:energy-coupling factor transport system permease protein